MTARNRRVRLLTAGSLVAAALSSGTALAQRLPPSVSLVGATPVRIGSVNGPPETSFAGIVGAVLLSSGDIAVADAGNHAIRVFDVSGTHVRTIGREGEGPSEFRHLRWLGACPDGNLLAVDPVLGRASVISSGDGRLVRTVPWPSWVLFNQPLSCERDDQLLVLLSRPRVNGERGQVTRVPASLVRFRLGSQARDSLVTLPGTDYYFATRRSGFAPVALGGRTYAASGGGYVYIGQNDGEEVSVVALASRRQSRFAHRLPRPDLTLVAWEAAKADIIEHAPLQRTRTLLTEVLAEAPMPAQHPFFMDMKADRAGRAWLRLPSSTDTTVWQVRNHSGEHVGSVRLPSSVEPLDIADRHLIALERGVMGVQFILVYTFSQPLL